MAMWDTGHFDSDTAVDFSADLDEASADRRTEIVRKALADAAGTYDYLDSDVAVVAVAAAALVAEQCPGGPPVETVYGPDEALPRFPEELRSLAVRALDRVIADGSGLRDIWVEADGENGEWNKGIAELRGALVTAIPAEGTAVRSAPTPPPE
ncbi:DUF4259 domain-containing protein [Streptomyces sp. NPDC088400]|uniref:DUF4259 domain-containing protein n=1 Tax=Streptomyces sp. NPDC088400 TaxID=3365861 RepID=UPI00381757DB